MSLNCVSYEDCALPSFYFYLLPLLLYLLSYFNFNYFFSVVFLRFLVLLMLIFVVCKDNAVPCLSSSSSSSEELQPIIILDMQISAT